MRTAFMVIVLAGLRIGIAHADFASASAAYDRKDFAAAVAEFERLAEQGEADAQYNLALMLINADGAKKDALTGYGWVLAAEDNGLKQATAVADQLRRMMTAAQTAAAQDYVVRYGRASMLPPHPELFRHASIEWPRSATKIGFTFPTLPLQRSMFGWVEAVYVIGADGQVHDTWSGYSIPPGEFDDAVRTALVRARFEPGKADGKPTSVLGLTTIKFAIAGDTVRDRPRFITYIGEVRKQAERGDAFAQFELAAFGTSYPELVPETGDPFEWRRKAAAAGNVGAQVELGLCELLGWNRGCPSSASEGVQLLGDAARHGAGTAVMLMAFVSAVEGTTEGDIRAVRWLRVGAASGQGTAMKYLADFLASSPHEQIRDPDGAERLAKPLRESVLFKNDPDVWQISAAAAAARHDYKAALAFQDKAIDRAKVLGWTTEGLQARRTRFTSGNEARDYVLDRPNAFSRFSEGSPPRVCEGDHLGSRLAQCH